MQSHKQKNELLDFISSRYVKHEIALHYVDRLKASTNNKPSWVAKLKELFS